MALMAVPSWKDKGSIKMIPKITMKPVGYLRWK